MFFKANSLFSFSDSEENSEENHYFTVFFTSEENSEENHCLLSLSLNKKSEITLRVREKTLEKN